MGSATNCLWIELLGFGLYYLFDNWLCGRDNRRGILGLSLRRRLLSADVGPFLTNFYIDRPTSARRTPSFYSAECSTLKRNLFGTALGFSVCALLKCKEGLFLSLINRIALLLLR